MCPDSQPSKEILQVGYLKNSYPPPRPIANIKGNMRNIDCQAASPRAYVALAQMS